MFKQIIQTFAQYVYQTFHEKFKVFITPALLGGISGGTFLFSQPFNWVHQLGEFLLRLLGAAVFAFVTGLCGVFAKDCADKWKVKKSRKPRKYEKRKRSTEEDSAEKIA